MINLNEIAFIDEDGFDFNTGESLIRFDVVAYYPDTKQITFAITNQGKILSFVPVVALSIYSSNIDNPFFSAYL